LAPSCEEDGTEFARRCAFDPSISAPRIAGWQDGSTCWAPRGRHTTGKPCVLASALVVCPTESRVCEDVVFEFQPHGSGILPPNPVLAVSCIVVRTLLNTAIASVSVAAFD